MNKRRVYALVAAALVAGLTAGSLGVAAASTKSATSKTASATHAARPPGGGPGGQGGGREGGDMLVRVVAKLTGESTTTVSTARRSGTSFSAIASAKGVTADQVVTLALAADNAALDSQVSNGLLTQADETAELARHKAGVTQAVNATGQPQPPAGGPGAGRGSSDNTGTPSPGAPPAPGSAGATSTAGTSAK